MARKLLRWPGAILALAPPLLAAQPLGAAGEVAFRTDSAPSYDALTRALEALLP
jgi:hypothetical protein